MNRRFLSLISASALLLQASPALAAYVTPGALYLHLIQNQMRAADVTAKAYIESPMDDTHVYMEMSSAWEGRTIDTLKQKIGFMINGSSGVNGNFRVSGEVMMHQGMLYFRLNEMDTDSISSADPAFAMLQSKVPTPWLTADLKEQMMNGGSAFTGNFGHDLQMISDELATANIHVSPTEIKEMIKSVVDAIFQMDRSRFSGGNTYMLSLHPQFMERLLTNQVMYDLMEKMTGESIDARDMTEAMGEIREVQSMIEEALTVKMKFDTNEEHDLRFARMYMALDHHQLPIKASMQVEATHRIAGVYLPIPPASQTQDLEEFFGVSRHIDTNAWEAHDPWDDMFEEEEEGWGNDDWNANEWGNDDWSMDEWNEWDETDEWSDVSEPEEEPMIMPAPRRNSRRSTSGSDCDSRSTLDTSAYLRRETCSLKPNPRSIRSDAWEGSQSVNGAVRLTTRSTTSPSVVTPSPKAEMLSEEYSNSFSHLMAGDPDAKITLYVYADLEDPYFARHHATIGKILAKHSDVNWVYNPYPLYFHQNSLRAAVAAECVYRSKSHLLDDFISYALQGNTTKADITRFASMHALPSDFDTCINDATLSAEISAAQSAAYLAGVNGSPTTFVVNNRARNSEGVVKISGAQMEGAFVEAINNVKNAR